MNLNERKKKTTQQQSADKAAREKGKEQKR
jgi:hypothetical protein